MFPMYRRADRLCLSFVGTIASTVMYSHVLSRPAFAWKKVGTLILAFPIMIFVKREIQWYTLGTLESYPGLLIGVNKNFKIFSSRLKRSVTRCKR